MNSLNKFIYIIDNKNINLINELFFLLISFLLFHISFFIIPKKIVTWICSKKNK